MSDTTAPSEHAQHEHTHPDGTVHAHEHDAGHHDAEATPEHHDHEHTHADGTVHTHEHGEDHSHS